MDILHLQTRYIQVLMLNNQIQEDFVHICLHVQFSSFLNNTGPLACLRNSLVRHAAFHIDWCVLNQDSSVRNKSETFDCSMRVEAACLNSQPIRRFVRLVIVFLHFLYFNLLDSVKHF